MMALFAAAANGYNIHDQGEPAMDEAQARAAFE